jgi:hypothetical protein
MADGRARPLRLSQKMQVLGVVLQIGIKAALDEAAIERDRERVFAETAREYRALKPPQPTNRLIRGSRLRLLGENPG